MPPKTAYRLNFRRSALISLVILMLNACSFSLLDMPQLFPPTKTPSYPIPPTSTPAPHAEVVFNVTIPVPLLPGETLYLSVVDEVSGLAMNPVNYAMQSLDLTHFTVTLPFPMYSVVTYRYFRQFNMPLLEDDPFDQPVRYRMAYISGGGTIKDVVASWVDSPFSGSTGRVSGVIRDAAGSPLTNILVALGGKQTLTDSTGAFILDAVMPWDAHTLVAYALDGSYSPFQQGVFVAASKNTPVTVTMHAAPPVKVTFVVGVPSNTIPSAPIRLAGNLYQLGNTYSDLQGGLSSVATRMPQLSLLPDGRYTIEIELPAGTDLHYKYTLGDGFWNAEHLSGGGFNTRQFIVPTQGTAYVTDAVQTWQSGPSAPITFEAAVPADTPVGDIISIQFNPYDWTEPIPMWSLGNNQWVYILYSPLNMLGSFEYRYCRNDQCGAADDVETIGDDYGQPIATSLMPQDLQDTVTAWNWMTAPAASPVIGVSVQPRQNFWTGVEFQAGYDPTWQAWMPLALQNVQVGINADWVVLTPTWTSSSNPFVFAPQPGRDPLWVDTADTIDRARASGLNVALFPSAALTSPYAQWWTAAPRDSTWWQMWFERYQAFAVYYADLAARSGSQALILGGEWIMPALPGGSLPGGGSSGVPADAGERWAAVIAAVRQHYNGPLYWALTYSGGQPELPGFAASLDGLYVLWNTSISSAAAPTIAEMQARAGQLLDTDLQPLSASLQKPIVLAFAVPSVTGSASACISNGSGGCLPWTALNQPFTDIPALQINLQTQSDVYVALLGAVNARAWVGGFVSRGYYPPAVLLDKSASVHGKPAANILWYWYPRMRGVTP